VLNNSGEIKPPLSKAARLKPLAIVEAARRF
jgi:hypothetical protein